MKFIDLFAGVGGFRYGLSAVRPIQPNDTERSESNNNIENQSQQRECLDYFQCVYSNEWDKYANSVYRKHFGECDDRDIRTVPSSDIPDHDLLVGGFPCQAFSVAGKRAGFDDTRGTLFFEIARILRDKRPRYFILENVKGLLSHDSGKTFQTILGVLSDIGYGVQWQVLNSKDFGVPQNRERVFIVGHLRGTPRPQVFPIRTSNSKTNGKLEYVGQVGDKDWAGDGKRLSRNAREGYRVYSDQGLAPALRSQLGGASKGSQIIQVNQPTHSNDRVYSDDGISPSLNTMQGGRRQPKIVAQRGRYNSVGKIQQQIEPRPDYISNTLTAVQKDNMVLDNVRIRRLTPVECERLQGFPDNWTQYGAEGELISDTQRYKMMGNAVTTLVITEIGRKLIQTKEVNQV